MGSRSSQGGLRGIRIGSGSWQNLARYQYDNFRGYVELDISAIADGQPDVQIRWRYHNAYYSYYWGVDNVRLVGSTVGGPTPGDFDADDDVDYYDLSTLALAWLTGHGDDYHNPACDIYQPPNNFIDMLDYGVLSENWQPNTP